MLASLNSTFHHVCTLVKHTVHSRLYLHIILQGCSVFGVLRSPLFPLCAFHFHPPIKPYDFLLYHTFYSTALCTVLACPVLWHILFKNSLKPFYLLCGTAKSTFIFHRDCNKPWGGVFTPWETQLRSYQYLFDIISCMRSWRLFTGPYVALPTADLWNY